MTSQTEDVFYGSHGIIYLTIFLFFLSILAVFWPTKRPKNAKIKKYVFVTYQILENVIKRFGFCQFSSFLVNFGCFFTKKDQKMTKSKMIFFCIIFFVGRHLHTKFQKISSNGLDFANFLHFWSIFAVF